MFYRYGYAEHPAITHCRLLINEAMTYDDAEVLKEARQILDEMMRSQMTLNVGELEVQHLLEITREKRNGVRA